MTSPWRNLALLLHPLQQWIYQDQCPELGCPGRPTKDPQFTPVRRRFLCTPRKCQYSPCAEGTHMHTCASAHAGTRTCTYTHACLCTRMPSTDVCALTCTPASPRDTALFPCCSRPAKPFQLLVDSLGPPALAALLPGASCPLAPDRRDPESSELGQSLAGVGFGGLPSLPSGAQMPRPSCLSLPSPTLCPPSLPKYLPWRCCPAVQTCPPWLPDPLSLLCHQNTPPSKSWCVRPR